MDILRWKFDWEFFQSNLLKLVAKVVVKLVVKLVEDFDWDNFLFNFDRRFFSQIWENWRNLIENLIGN